MTCSYNKYLLVNKSRIKFIHTEWTKIDWANSNDVAACVSIDQSIVSFLFSVLAGPSGKYFKIKIESVVKNQGPALKKICIEATLIEDYVRMQEVASDVYNVYLSIKGFDFNDSSKIYFNESPSLDISKSKVVVPINGKNLELDFFQDVKLNIELGNYEAELDGSHSIPSPRVKASYYPISSNDASWARDRLELKFEAESRNSYFNIDVIEKLIDIFTGMLKQNVFEILPHTANVNYVPIALPIQNNLPVSPLTINCLRGVLSFIGPHANFYDLSNISESVITSHTAENIRNNTALMCQILAHLRAGLLTLALGKGKVIRMYPRIDNEIDISSQKNQLADPTIKIRKQDNNDIVLAGTGQPGATISIFRNNDEFVGNSEVDPNGFWEYIPILRNGIYTLFCNQICLNGHTRKSDTVNITIYYQVADPTIKKLDNITNDNCPVITGTGEPGAIISISANGQELKGITTVCIVCIDGSWEFMNESYFSNGHYKFQARQDCERASKKSNIISTQIFVLPDPPWEIEKAFEESEYIDDVILLKASVRYMLDSFQIVTIGKFLEASIEKALSIGEKNYRNIIESLKREANNRLILQNNSNCKLD